ncbi:hypothetical protein PhCBS80983_g00214 [Powellomyces hirtus]|uniref:Rho-GAP domain-containing protein n=1 Tax=Powellomyces hirtus TaxID=109895 RepID=A0A507EG69_9FUNG|nr:hypothetical protein PhCBS80983_g00214 [Powellomyces hirtus]
MAASYPSPRPFASLPRIPSTPLITIEPAETIPAPPTLPRRQRVQALRKSDETHSRPSGSAASSLRRGDLLTSDSAVKATAANDWWAGVAKWAAGRFRGKSLDAEDVAAEAFKVPPRIDSMKAWDSDGGGGQLESGRKYGPRSISLEMVRTFGIPLDILVDRERELSKTNPKLPNHDPIASSVPRLIITCCTWLETNAIDKEGLYRVPGSIRRVVGYQEQLDSGSFPHTFPAHESPHTVASLLKKFLSSLPDGIWGPPDTRKRLREAAQTSTHDELFAADLSTILPTSAHHATLRYIMRHLHRISSHSDTNKMTSENLAISMFPGMELVVELLIDHWTDIYGPDDYVHVEEEAGHTMASAAE